MKSRYGLFLIVFIVFLAVVVAFAVVSWLLVAAKRQKTEDEATAMVAEVRFMELPKLSHIENSIFVTHYLPEPDKGNVRNYSILYDTLQKVSYWVAYPLHSTYLGESGRSDAWDYDLFIGQHLQPRLHKGIPGFDRGHQLPSADRTYSRTGNATTFYFTNITAQNASLNRGVWSTLENRVRKWVAQCDTLYVVAGAMITQADDSEINPF